MCSSSHARTARTSLLPEFYFEQPFKPSASTGPVAATPRADFKHSTDSADEEDGHATARYRIKSYTSLLLLLSKQDGVSIRVSQIAPSIVLFVAIAMGLIASWQ